jgi:hypothetical protein
MMNEERTTDLDIHVSLGGRDYYIRKTGANGWLRVTGTKKQYDLGARGCAIVCPYIERSVDIDPCGRLGQKILKAGGVKI